MLTSLIVSLLATLTLASPVPGNGAKAKPDPYFGKKPANPITNNPRENLKSFTSGSRAPIGGLPSSPHKGARDTGLSAHSNGLFYELRLPATDRGGAVSLQLQQQWCDATIIHWYTNTTDTSDFPFIQTTTFKDIIDDVSLATGPDVKNALIKNLNFIAAGYRNTLNILYDKRLLLTYDTWNDALNGPSLSDLGTTVVQLFGLNGVQTPSFSVSKEGGGALEESHSNIAVATACFYLIGRILNSMIAYVNAATVDFSPITTNALIFWSAIDFLRDFHDDARLTFFTPDRTEGSMAPTIPSAEPPINDVLQALGNLQDGTLGSGSTTFKTVAQMNGYISDTSIGYPDCPA